MGCGNEVTNEDFRKIEEARQGKHGGLDKSYLTAEKWEEVNKNIKEPQQEKERIDRQVQKMKDAHRLQKMKDIYGAKPINDVIMKYEGDGVSEEEAEELAERIKNSDPNDALLILREEDPSPFFTPGFNDVGDKVEFSQDDEEDSNKNKETEEWPEIKVYSPIQPTIENLGNLLEGKNPYNPWDDKVTWHHIEQEKDNIGVVTMKSHGGQDYGVMHEKGKKLGEENRKEWQKIKPKIIKQIARNYLGKYGENQKVVSTLVKKAGEVNVSNKSND